MANNKIVFMHFIRQPPLTWKRQGATGKFRWRDKKALAKAKENLGWEIKAAEPKLRVNACARFGYRAEFHIWNRADGDNLEKLLMDALQGIVWLNDEQVDEGAWSKKIVATNAGIRLMIYEIEP
jgi:Holliday junction resolvase RusA-like endonuclease